MEVHLDASRDRVHPRVPPPLKIEQAASRPVISREVLELTVYTVDPAY